MHNKLLLNPNIHISYKILRAACNWSRPPMKGKAGNNAYTALNFKYANTYTARSHV